MTDEKPLAWAIQSAYEDEPRAVALSLKAAQEGQRNYGPEYLVVPLYAEPPLNVLMARVLIELAFKVPNLVHTNLRDAVTALRAALSAKASAP